MRHYKNILILLFILAGVSCSNDEQCRKDRYVALQAGIYHSVYNGTTKKTTYTSLPIDSITVKGVGIDSILYNKKRNISSITLPLNKLANESSFQITFNNVTDTISIFHFNYDTYLSLECGCIKTHTIDTVLTTNHFLDSVRISNHDVNTSTSAKEHIKLYN